MHRKALGRGLDALIPNPRDLLPSPGSTRDPLPPGVEETLDYPAAGAHGPVADPLKEAADLGSVGALADHERAVYPVATGGAAVAPAAPPPASAGSPRGSLAGLGMETRHGLASGRAGTVIDVPLDRITPNPYQPREQFVDDETEELASSIRTKGVLQPILVRRHGVGYQLIAGERRLRGARRAGLAAIPAIVREAADRDVLELALIENEQRVDLNPIESARSYARIIDEFHLTQIELADVLGRDRSTVSNLLRLLRLPEKVQGLVRERRLSMGHARALAALEESPRCISIAERAARLGMSVRAVERLVQAAPRRRAGRVHSDPELAPFEERLRHRMGTQVTIRRRQGRGRIEIEFYSAADLERILDELQVLRDG